MQAGLFAPEQAEEALAMVDGRNLTVHLYKEAVARQIFERLPHHAGDGRGEGSLVGQRFYWAPK